MKKLLIIIAISLVITGIFVIPPITEQLADAGSTRKVHFTQTISSSQDPGQGHESHQLALILSPNAGTIYDGSLTYTASEPVQIVVLHEIVKEQAKNQPIWTVDGNTVYGLSLIDQDSSSGSFEFTGAALALHTTKPSQFTATVSVDGWIRGQPTEVIMQKLEIPEPEPTLELARANVPATIPLHEGTFDGETVHYIITDTNDKTIGEQITEQQNWKVELAPPLSNATQDSLDTVYLFKDGVVGNGIHGYQNEVFSSTPSQTDEYSALRLVTNVTWKPGQNPEIFESADAIVNASEAGRIELETTDTVLNMPQITWPDGQMQVRGDKELTGDTYTGGQVLDINTENMTVTFVAHRGWGPDGRTIYYIVTDATPTGPAEMMGVIDAPTSGNLITSPAAVDLFQFLDGIKSSGPVGFQPGIAAAAPGDETYSPMWRIYMISWLDPEQAVVLETKDDIDALKSEGLITVSLARPMNSVHIVNCPFIDPFQSINATAKNG